ncbi:MAG: tetratricopeptide repeat protein [Leptonema sp. (in: bacteria)]
MKDKIRLAKEYEDIGNWEKSYQIYKNLYKETRNSKLLFKLGYLASKLKNHTESIQYYLDYTKIHTKDANAFHNLGIEYFQIQDYENSKKMLLKSIEIEPNFIRSYLLLGYVYELLEDHQNALKIFFSILKKEPKNKLAIEGTILSFVKLKNYEKAYELCNHYLKIFPEDTTLRNLKTGILLNLNKTEEFYQELKEITEKDTKYKSFENFIVELKTKRQKEYTEFANEVQKKIILKTKEIQEKENSKSYLDLSLLSLFSGDKENALKYLKKALESKQEK